MDLYDLPANTKIIIDEAHPDYKIEDGAILSKDGTIFKLLRDDDVEDYEVKEGVKTIGKGAFYGTCSRIYSRMKHIIGHSL